MTVLEGVSRPIAMFLATILGIKEGDEEAISNLQQKVEGFMWIVIIILGIVLVVKVYKAFK